MVVKDGIFPVPVAVSPMLVFELIQLKIVPETNPLKLTSAVGAPVQSS